VATLARLSLLSFVGFASCLPSGCNLVPAQALRQSQLRAAQFYQQNKVLAFERDQASQLAQALAAEKDALAMRAGELQQQIASLQNDLAIAHGRAENFSSERGQLQQKLVSALNQLQNQPSPLSSDATRRFEELAQKYPEFEFDPATGVSKFHSDILFDSGSDELKQRGGALLQEFAQILNQGEARRLNILVVGHTDDQRIARSSTAQRHPTNWHLSTNRANSVILSLSKSGIAQNRMGAAGYSMYQPVVPNTDAKSRQQNRRVEIFVLAPDAVVAGWDPATSRN
jgi:chemotaxis protein MotB